MNGAGPRRIMFFLPTLRAGGAERVVVTLLRHLDRDRYRLALAVIDLSEAVYRRDIPDNVEVIDLGCSRVRYALPRIARLIWSKRPDVVFSTLGHLNLALATLRPLLPAGCRYLGRETSVVSRVIADSRWPAAWTWAYRRFYHRLDLVVCQSRYMRDDLIRHYAVPPDKAVVINNPVDTSRIRELAGNTARPAAIKTQPHLAPLQLLAVGRLSAEKGFDMLIDALALCGQPGPQLTLVGDGPLRAELEQMTRDRGLHGRVVFAGFQANPYPFFHAADALVVSSHYEGFPNVALEALACGTPVISTPAAGGVAEIIGGVAGCRLADAISAESLAREIQRFSKGARIPPDVVRPYEVGPIVRRYEEAFS